MVVRDEHEGDAERPLQRFKLLLHLLAQLQVERSQRLVEQQDLRLVDERARQRHPLPLPAGQLTRPPAAIAGKLDELERLFGLAVALRLRHALHHQPIGDIVENVEMREERVILKHGVDVAPIGWHALRLFAKDGDAARCRLFEAGDQPQAGRLARARGAEHGEELARSDFQIDRVDSAHGAEMA